MSVSERNEPLRHRQLLDHSGSVMRVRIGFARLAGQLLCSLSCSITGYVKTKGRTNDDRKNEIRKETHKKACPEINILMTDSG